MERKYNEGVKREYLDRYSNLGTRNTLEYMFRYSFPIEERLNKDLYDFSLDEIKTFLSQQPVYHLSMAKNRVRIISSYISWSIQSSLSKYKSNPLLSLTSDWYEELIDSGKYFLSEIDIHEILEKLNNSRDKAIVSMIYSGIRGSSDSEVRNLRKTDIKPNRIRLFDDKKGERFLRSSQLSDKTMEYIKLASEQKIYKSKNGDSLEKWGESKLANSDYVIRPAIRGRSGERISSLANTIKKIGEEVGILGLTSKRIQQSGMIAMGARLLGDKKDLDKHDIKKLGDRFNFTPIKSRGYIYHNSVLIKEIVSVNNMMKTFLSDERNSHFFIDEIEFEYPAYKPGQIISRYDESEKICFELEKDKISISEEFNMIFLFADRSTGDGFRRGNYYFYSESSEYSYAVEHHLDNQKDLFLFEKIAGVNKYSYINEFICTGITQTQDKESVYELTIPEVLFNEYGSPLYEKDLQKLRELAIEKSKVGLSPTEKKKKYVARSNAIKKYALIRARGICELCEKSAPFENKLGEPFLEVHHLNKLSDGGTNHPRNVAALCPNCHREIHFGIKGAASNKSLVNIVEIKEIQLGNSE